jgi:pyridoxamine 5'-phosphate oxidase
VADASTNLNQIRSGLRAAAFDESTVAGDPFAQFARWYDDACAAGEPEPNAMTLATADADGTPNARILLLKAVTGRNFVFYSNYHSRKGHELEVNPRATIVFHWPSLERQVRAGGTVAKVERAVTDEYFRTRPLGSRAGAWASPQGQPISSRAWLEAEVARIVQSSTGWRDQAPPHWGGYALTPTWLEFWQGRPDRLHDRLRYRLVEEDWIVERLAP